MGIASILENLPAPKPDLIVTNHGSTTVINMVTPLARQWVEQNVDVPDWAWMGLGFACEPRMVEQLVEGAEAAGLEVRS